MLRTLGLLLWSIPYVDGALNQIREPAPRAERGRAVGLPATERHVQLSGAAMLAAAVGLLLPPFRRPSAAFLALQTLGVTLIGHRFWELEPGPQREQQWLHFTKNLAMAGAGLILAGGPNAR